MRFSFCVVFSKSANGKPKQRITTRAPSLFKGEVAVRFYVDVPDEHFRMVINAPIILSIPPPNPAKVGIQIGDVREAP